MRQFIVYPKATLKYLINHATYNPGTRNHNCIEKHVRNKETMYS